MGIPAAAEKKREILERLHGVVLVVNVSVSTNNYSNKFIKL
jgi:hypothetical protein